MQIVIDIPNSDIPLKQNVITLDLHFIDGHICECTYPFKELPKKHGRLIDASELIKSYMKSTKTDIDDFYETIDIIDNTPTILEAKK